MSSADCIPCGWPFDCVFLAHSCPVRLAHSCLADARLFAGNATCLTIDHNPNTHEGERLRVEAAGGRIEKMNWQVLS